MIDFFKKLAIPDSCYLGKRVYKKLFYENAQLNSTDKKAFMDDIDKITWRYTLKPETINIAKYEDGEREYLEIAVIDVVLKSPNRRKRIGEVIQRAIPYPVLLIFVHGDKVALSVAEKRIRRSDSSKIMVEAHYDTHWLTNGKKGFQEDFLADFCITNFSFHNFFDFYQDMVQRIIALNCAMHTGQYFLTKQNTDAIKTGERATTYGNATIANERLHVLQELEKLQQEKIELCNRLKKENNMGTQVQLNIKVKQLSDQIKKLLGRL